MRSEIASSAPPSRNDRKKSLLAMTKVGVPRNDRKKSLLAMVGGIIPIIQFAECTLYASNGFCHNLSAEDAAFHN